MACPFAFFARSSSNDEDNNIAGPSRSRLTEQLKSGTWEAHREIEKSAGVRALMGSHHAELAVRFDRMDHLNYLIMLGCIYLTMESVLFNIDSALRDIMPQLIRSELLLNDIQVHLDEILSSRGATVSELDHSVDEDAESLHESILAQVTTAQVSLKRVNVLQTSFLLTADHIALLTKRQAKAVQLYLEQVLSLTSFRNTSSSSKSNFGHYDEGISFTPLNASSPFEKSTSISSFLSRPSLPTLESIKVIDNRLILAHAYVRYMGDLSGGQHIVKRLSKLFPIYNNLDVISKQDGFRFYSFASTEKSNSTLKEMIRIRLDALDLTQWEVKTIVDEASQAFLLNGKLLDSLVDEMDTTTIALEMARSRSTFLSSINSLTFISMHLYHSHTFALVAASLLCVGLASALFALAL